MKEIEDVLEDICIKYPQVELYLKSKHMSNIVDLMKASKDADKMESEGINIEEFKIALANVDSQVKSLPATAQVVPDVLKIVLCQKILLQSSHQRHQTMLSIGVVLGPCHVEVSIVLDYLRLDLTQFRPCTISLDIIGRVVPDMGM